MNRLVKKLIIPILVVVLFTGIILIILYNDQFTALEDRPLPATNLNILITGIDDSPGDKVRTDTIIIASVNLESGALGVLFVPRDTKVEIPGRLNRKVNAAYALGGMSLMEKTLESFLGIDIDYYLRIDFEAFSRMIDIIGGVEIEVKDQMYYVDQAGDLYIDLLPGVQVLDGEQALDYVRYREPIYGDIGRIQRQQKFIKALMQRVLQPNIITKIPYLYKEYRQTVRSNIPLVDVAPFIQLFRRMELAKMKTTMIPGEPEYINQISFWVPDLNRLELLVNNLIHSKEYLENNQYRLTVLNGSGVRGVATELALDLQQFGFDIERVANVNHFDYETTIIEYFVEQDKEAVLRIQQLIGGKVEYREADSKGITIIIGHDYSQ